MQDPKEKAVSLLKNSPKTEREMRSALEKSGFSQEGIDETIEFLVDLGYMDDVKYAVDFVEMSMAKKRGPLRIKRELEAKGVESDIIEDSIRCTMDDQWEWDMADQIVTEIKSNNPSLKEDKILAKIVNKLTYEGFSDDVINEIVGKFYGY